MTTAHLQDELRERLRDVRRRWTAVAALRAAARGTGAAALMLGSIVVLDRALRFDGIPLVLLMSAGIVLVGLACAAAVWMMPATPTDQQVARFVEERTRTLDAADLNDSLVSAVDALGRPPESQPVFLAMILSDVVHKLRAIDASTLVTRRAVRQEAILAGAGALALLIAFTGAMSPFGRAIDTARVRLFPGSVRVEVQPGNLRIPIGTSVHIRASVKRTEGATTQVAPMLTVFADGQRREVPMASAPAGFEYAIQSVDRTFSYDVRAGGARSERYTVTALRPPHVARIDLHYVYPAFAGLAPRDEQDGGDIYAPAGTRIRLRVHADQPIVQGELRLARSPRVALQRTDDRTFEADLVLAKDDSYRIRIADGEGLSSPDEAEYFIRLMDDRPPDVRILRPSADQQITPLEEVPIEARADDDYGIGRFELVYAVAGGPEHVVPFDKLTGTAIEKMGTRVLPAEDLGVKPGDVITYSARATDVGRGKRPTEATSDIFFLEVKPFNEEFIAAESQAGSGGSDSQIESLIQGQKEIIASTWNVERRSHAARSSTDVKAIAAAQTELKARAEEQLMSRTTRNRGRSPAPQRAGQTVTQPQSSAGDPAATALGAMGKAVDQLTSERTKDALSHEMTALNGLLQLQAEVRRRQVSQSASGSGNGGNRQGQDLSALFDKELQRQQRTNYENRSAAETRPDKADASASALDRIRDLAKRQEDLSRRQQELAHAGLDAAELKRQLEKLTREQTELREQAEDLLRRMGQDRNASAQKGASAPPTDDGRGDSRNGDLRGAADQMRSAASELRREAPGDAARSGERAAEQLRRLERQLANDTQARGSTGSDVKLEAQQIAQEQRRIAQEAVRMDGNAGNGRNGANADTAGADARRRLADDKDRLAARVDEMTRAAERGGQTGTGPDAKSLADAARSLQRDRIADRMRSTASELRHANGNNGSAAEQELARSLDQLAGKLGSGGSQLADQLEQTRAIREGVQRAEQQLRDAEARARDGGRRGAGSSTESRGKSGGQGASSADVQRQRDEYQRELQRAQDALRRLNGNSTSGLAGATPEEQEFSGSAPGTEAFKQDRSDWASLRKNVDTALEKYEASLSDRLARTTSKDRFSAGGSDRVPDAYSQLISRYFESLAQQKK
jgi:hypothetical protein